MFVTGLVDRLDVKKHWQPAVRAIAVGRSVALLDQIFEVAAYQ
jgi:hypothetical protein